MIGLNVITNTNVNLQKVKKQKQFIVYRKGDNVGKIIRETPTMYITDTGIRLPKLVFGNDICNGHMKVEA